MGEGERETGIGSRERRVDAEMGNSASQAGRRSGNRDAQTTQSWTGTSGVPDSKSWTQGFLHTAAWQMQRQPEPAAEYLLVNSLSPQFDAVMFQFKFA